jgi:hypothetical protein
VDTVAISLGRDKRVLIHCHKCGDNKGFLDAIGLTDAELYDDFKSKSGAFGAIGSVVKSYPYPDAQGVVRYYVDRYVPKTFRPRMADGSKGFPREARILYNLPQVLAAIPQRATIFVVEGEKDSDNLAAKTGVVATTMPGGTGMGWQESYTDSLVGAVEVVIVSDNDPDGQGVKHARKVAASLARRRIPHRIVLPAVGKDISDHLAAGLEYGDLQPIDQDPPEEEYEEPPLTDEPQDDIETRRLILTPASQIKIKPVRWLWDTTPEGAPPTSHGRIPMYSMAIAAGGPGLGKSQFAVWFTARITRGELPGELSGKPRGVIYAATEDSWTYTIAPRLIAAGADLDLVFRVDVKDDESLHARLTLPVDISLIGKAAEEYSVALLVADPLLSLIDKSINDYRAAEVREALEPLVAAADRHHFTVLGLAHFTKSGTADPLSRVAGSGAFGQLIRSLLAFAQQETDDGETEFVMSLEKNNLGRLGLPSFSYDIKPFTVPTDEGPSYVSRFVLGPESTTSVKEVMRAEGQPDDREAMNDAMAWLDAYLADVGGSDMAREIKKAARKAGISDSAIDRAKLKLRLKSKQEGFGKDKAAHWYLPDAYPGSGSAA